MTAVMKTSKARDFAMDAEGEGWQIECTVDGNTKTVQATRDDEILTVSWTENVWDEGFYSTGDDKWVGVPTALAARRILAQMPIGWIPYDPETSTDPEILDAVRGKQIKWLNELTDMEEVGTVPENGRMTRIDILDSEDPMTRQITFCDAGGYGFRTVRVNAVVKVGHL